MRLSRCEMQWKVFKAKIPMEKWYDVWQNLLNLGYELPIYKFTYNMYSPNADNTYIYTGVTHACILELEDEYSNDYLFSLISHEEVTAEELLSWERSADMKRLLHEVK